MQGLRDLPDITDFTNLSHKDKLLQLILYGQLAPSTRNTQPWHFQIISGESVVVSINRARILPLSDPQGREAYISVGACVGNMIIAAKALGIDYQVHFESVNKEALRIKISFVGLDNQITPDHLTLNSLLNRHNSREFFTKQQIPEELVATAQEICSENGLVLSVVKESYIKNEIINVILKAVHTAFTDRGFLKEASDWLRSSRMKYRDGMPGYNLGIPWLISFIIPFMLRNFDLSKTQIKMHKKWLDSSPVFFVFSSINDDQENWLNTGIAFEKIAIEAEKQGIKYSVMAAAIEIDQHHQDLQRLLRLTGRPQMFVRLGYAEGRPDMSPRLANQTVMINNNV